MCSQTPSGDLSRRQPVWPAALAAVSLAALVVVPMHGMIRTLPLLELVKRSDFIITAVVEKVSVVGNGRAFGGLAVLDLQNELKPLDTLKGTWPSGQTVVLSTIKPEKGWREDNVEIPPAGSRVLLFLAKGPDGRLVPVNGIQGVWPMKGETLRGMGLGKSLADVREGVKKGDAAAVFAQGVQLQKQGDLKGAVEKYTQSLRDWPDKQLQYQTQSLELKIEGRLTSMFKRDDIPCGQADQDGEEVPANFSITSGGGPAHAAWGAANATTVNARGEVNQREDVRPGQTGAVTATARTITREAVKRIYAQVVACGFFELEPTYRDPQVMDGGSNYVSVTANGKTHSVAMVNFDVDRVWSIVRVLGEEIEAPK